MSSRDVLLRCHFFKFFFNFYGYHLDLHSFPTRRSSDLAGKGLLEGTLQAGTSAVSDKLLDLVGLGGKSAADKGTYQKRSEERFSRNAETDIVCRLLLEKKNT